MLLGKNKRTEENPEETEMKLYHPVDLAPDGSWHLCINQLTLYSVFC